MEGMGAPPGVAENTVVPVELDERLTVSATVVGLPNGSCSWTVIGPMLAELDAMADAGFEVKTNWEGGAARTLKGELVPEVSPVSLAERV